jgi:hypothetical protein
MRQRRFLVALLASAAITAATVGVASANGPQPGHLEDHGWTCLDVPDLGVHCAPPGRTFAPPAPVEEPTPLLYWFETTDPSDTDADFTGTEMLLPFARYHGQPCPQEGLDEWMDIGIARACHHQLPT